MRAYKFTTHLDTSVHDSDEPVDFKSDEAAFEDAQRALAELATDALPDGDHQHFYVAVHDCTGKEIYRATMNFQARHIR